MEPRKIALASAGGAVEYFLAQARPRRGVVRAWQARSDPARMIAGFLALILVLGALCVFAAADVSLGWQRSLLLAVAYLIAIGAFQRMLTGRFSSFYRRVEAERLEALQRSAERETMLAETQHRIANNLSVVSAMLSIQGRQLGDPAARNAIQGAAARIRVVAEINLMFNRLESTPARIDQAFVRNLVAKCIAVAGAEERVSYQISIGPTELPMRSLLPLALIINECVNNALEHGFPGDARGTITIGLAALSDEPSKHRLTIDDDGLGPPTEFDATEARSAGLMFVNSFAVQIGGSFRLEARRPGARSVLTF
jgi:two-component system, sensor histidine kinase PdtaS